VLALALLPFMLTILLQLVHLASRPRRRWSSSAPISVGQLLFLSFIAVLSHPILDTLNTYGVRWLMPFSGEWFYGDTLFIIDPWVWLALSVGVLSSVRRQKKNRPSREITTGFGAPVERAMVGPVPLNPFVREFVVEQGEHYRVGTFHWFPTPTVDLNAVTSYPRTPPAHPAVSLATRSLLGQRFLAWARFPTFQVEQVAEGRALVHVVDLRYARQPGDRFGAVSIPVTLPPGPILK
jgi:inner membrane protein